MNWYDPEFLDTVATILGAIGLIPVTLIIYYWGTKPIPGRRFLRTYSTQWKSFMPGRLLMYMLLTWEVFILFVVYRFLHPAEFPFELLRIGVYSLLIVIFCFMFVALRKSQKSGIHPGTGIDPEPPHTPRNGIRKVD